MSNALFLVCLMAYLAFLPIGPYDLTLGGLRVEYVLLGAVCATSLPLLSSSARLLRGNYARMQLLSFGYVATIGLTSALSSDPEVSTRAFGATVGYAYLTCIVPPLIYRHMQVMRKALLVMAAATAGLFLYLNIALGYGSTQRFALANSAVGSAEDSSSYVDPNMTAIGMLMCAVISLPLLWQIEQKGRWIYRMTYRALLGMVVGGALLFISRTAALSLIVAAFFGLISALGRGLRPVTVLRRSVPVLVMLALLAVWRSAEIASILDRTSNVFDLEEGHSLGRTDLFLFAWESWTSSIKAIIVGTGYYSLNPHNEFLRTLAGDGILGLITLMGLLLSVYVICCRKTSFTAGQSFSQNALFAFIVSAMMTYGHTKTMWLAFLFLMAGYLEAKDAEDSAPQEERSYSSQASPVKPSAIGLLPLPESPA